MATIYLDVDDEITSAAARIRESADIRIALVLPNGSRIATSRINFRLLQREARERSRRLSIVSPEVTARALAASAGLPVFATVMDYEKHVDDGEQEHGAVAPAGEATTPPPAASAGAAAGGGAAAGAGGTQPESAAASAGSARETGAGPARGIAQARPLSAAELAAREQGDTGPVTEGIRGGGSPRGAPELAGEPSAAQQRLVTRPERAGGGRERSSHRMRLAAAGIVVGLLLVAAAGVAGYLVLPTARIVLALRPVPVGPLELVVHADPQATTPDATELIVPAITLDLPLSATGTFQATGKRIVDKDAAGTLQWTNCDPTRSYTIPQGTLARTQAGIGFTDDEAIFLPVAIINPPRISCQSRTVSATAVQAGPSGNVPAGTVTFVPGSYNSVVIRVTNPAPMTGGSHQEFPKVTQKDVDGAVATLTGQLDAQLKSAAQAPSDLPPGATVFPATAARGQPTPGVDPTSLVGTEVQAFDLSLTATGTVEAVDPSPLRGIGMARLAAQVPSGHDVVAGSTSITVGQGTVAEGIISFEISATEQTVQRVDAAAIRDKVKGLTAAQVRTQLASLGDVTVVLWPDWVSTVTAFDPRLDVSVTGPPTEGAASPAPPGSASPAASSSPGSSGSGPPGSASHASSPGPAASVSPGASGSPAGQVGSAPPSASPAASGAGP